MINIFSIRCGLAFAPYLAESASEYLKDGGATSRVIRQGGSGLIIRADGEMMLRFQNRESRLGREEGKHYSATVQFRSEFYDVARMSDEVVLANLGRTLMLSHPQSDLWLGSDVVAELLAAFKSNSVGATSPSRLPDWINVSTGGGRLLISDQRNGRWVLLGADHVAELERRMGLLSRKIEPASPPSPPALTLKGLVIHLQSAFKLAEAIESFAAGGEIIPYEEVAPHFYLGVRRTVEGMEIRDSDNRASLTPREARKWVDIIRAELEKVKATQAERGNIRTVFAEGEGGRWVLQWGDEVFAPAQSLEANLALGGATQDSQHQPKVKRTDDFMLLLSESTGACVALTGSEFNRLNHHA